MGAAKAQPKPPVLARSLLAGWNQSCSQCKELLDRIIKDGKAESYDKPNWAWADTPYTRAPLQDAISDLQNCMQDPEFSQLVTKGVDAMRDELGEEAFLVYVTKLTKQHLVYIDKASLVAQRIVNLHSIQMRPLNMAV